MSSQRTERIGRVQARPGGGMSHFSKQLKRLGIFCGVVRNFPCRQPANVWTVCQLAKKTRCWIPSELGVSSRRIIDRGLV